MIVMTVFPFCRTIQGHGNIFYVEKHIALMVGVLLESFLGSEYKKGKEKGEKLYWVGRLLFEKYT